VRARIGIAVVGLALVAFGACSTFGSVDTSVSADSGTDSTADAPAPPPDGGPSRCATVADASDTCGMIGYCCPTDAPFCQVGIDYAAYDGGTNVVCAPREGAVGRGSACDPAAPACAPALVCAATASGHQCDTLCRVNAECGAAFCNVTIVGVTEQSGLQTCGACDVVKPTESDCAGASCKALGSSRDPGCGCACGQGAGSTCQGQDDCQPGLACVCATATGTGLGDDCKPDGGVCATTCYPHQRGSPCAGGICTLVGTDFAYCRL
jgi:hypothetical protein